MYREYLQKIIGFDEWHINSLNQRTYALHTINRINGFIQDGDVSPGTILEIGCGLGDIISSIQWHDRLGYDIDKKAIMAARILHPGTAFRIGSFDAVRDKKISVLIALNFMHRINDTDCHRYFSKLLKRNEVDLIIVDAVQSPPYEYAHDWEKLFGGVGFCLEYKSRGYVARRYSRRRILYFRRVKSFARDAES